MKKSLLLLMLLLSAVSLRADTQYPSTIIISSNAPSGDCGNGQEWINTTTNVRSFCSSSAWVAQQTALSTSAAVSHQYLTAFTAPNTFTHAQPVCADLSDSGTACTSAAANNAILNGFCTGAIGTANATEYGSSPAAANLACSSTIASNIEMPMPVACTAKNLRVNLGAAGATAGSGLVQIYKNGSADANFKCTTGTGTTCNDTTHTVSYNAGDTFKVSIKTNQSTDTIQNLRWSFQCQ